MNFFARRAPFALSSAALLVLASFSSSVAMPTHVLSGPARGVAPAVVRPPQLLIPGPAKKNQQRIKHVVIIMQENRGFDNLFQGYPGANTQSYGYDSNNNKVTLQPIPLEANYDIEHDIYSYFQACNGTGSLPGTDCQMNGFNKEYTGCRGSCHNPQYGYVPASETTTYFNMASQYVLADNMFTSHIDDSFISHQYIIAAQANGAAYFPSSSWGCPGGPSDTIASLSQQRVIGGPYNRVCWDINTLGDELDAAHKSWRFYASGVNGDGGIWSSYQAIKHIYYGSDWTNNVISPQTRVLTDIAAGQLAAVTWVMPTCATSDHSGCGSNKGPSWVASIVNAIGQNNKLWKSTAIFITWDEWGGWYDHVPPPFEDYDGLGMRVPLLMISPFAKQNYVSHVQYEQGSILRFAEDTFGLAPLAAADARANDPAVDCFDFTQKPRQFQTFAAKYSAKYIMNLPPDTRPADAE
jgi:phospholipase C